jgi:very-short-patch-repair endonuclease
LKRLNSSETRDFAREQRGMPTRAEELVWNALRARRFKGLKFKRQMPIGRYIADFCCFEQRLIVELDGKVHEDEPARRRDGVRDAWLRAEGYRVIRLQNELVLGNLDVALAKIDSLIRPAAPATFSPEGRRKASA